MIFRIAPGGHQGHPPDRITLTRGARVVVTGRLKQRSYTKDEQKRTVIELEVDEIGRSLRYATFRRVFTKSEVPSDGNPSIEAA